MYNSYRPKKFLEKIYIYCDESASGRNKGNATTLYMHPSTTSQVSQATE